jgi:hypothetical protein
MVTNHGQQLRKQSSKLTKLQNAPDENKSEIEDTKGLLSMLKKQFKKE